MWSPLWRFPRPPGRGAGHLLWESLQEQRWPRGTWRSCQPQPRSVKRWLGGTLLYISTSESNHKVCKEWADGFWPEILKPVGYFCELFIFYSLATSQFHKFLFACESMLVAGSGWCCPARWCNCLPTSASTVHECQNICKPCDCCSCPETSRMLQGRRSSLGLGW